MLQRLEKALIIIQGTYVQQVHYSVFDDELYKGKVHKIFTGKYWGHPVYNSQPIESSASVGLNVHWLNFQDDKPILEFLMKQFISIKCAGKVQIITVSPLLFHLLFEVVLIGRKHVF